MSSARPIRGPDGQPGWLAISCRRDSSYCLEQAGVSCPRGYDVVDSSGSSGVIVSKIGDSYIATPVFNGQMTVKCR